MASIGTGEAVTDRVWAQLPTTTTRSSICTAVSTSRVVAAPALISLDRTRSLLEAFHATWTWIDEPKFRDSVRWLQRRWRVSAKGNQWIRADGFRVTVYNKGNRLGATVASEDNNFVRHLRRAFRTANEAKLATFDFISQLLAS